MVIIFPKLYKMVMQITLIMATRFWTKIMIFITNWKRPYLMEFVSLARIWKQYWKWRILEMKISAINALIFRLHLNFYKNIKKPNCHQIILDSSQMLNYLQNINEPQHSPLLHHPILELELEWSLSIMLDPWYFTISFSWVNCVNF